MTEPLLQYLVRGQQALDAGHPSEAVLAFQAALQQAPDQLGVAFALANAQRLADDVVGARTTLVSASRQRPTTDIALDFQFGVALLDVGAAREAAAAFTRVMRARPHDPAPIGALAGARRAAGDPAAAWTFIVDALRRAPEQPAFLLTAAQIRHDLADVNGALDYLDRAERVRPGHQATRLQRAYTTLLKGPSREGWTQFESRALPVPRTSARAWHGESLANASILVTAEQGLGDQFQFVRFVRRLAAFSPSRVIVECHPHARALLVASGLDAVARGDAPETDWHVPMLSLPHRLLLDLDVDGALVPYLTTAPNASRPLNTRDPSRPLHLGIAWAGNPAFAGHATRDFDRALLPSLLSISHVRWQSLQQGDLSTKETLTFGAHALEPAPVLGDWSETAAQLGSLDGLVTTDTGIAHLAGAMGVPTWVLLQHVPDWRWGLHSTTTPWYPSLRLVRQTSPGDWSSVVAQLAESVSHLARSRSA